MKTLIISSFTLTLFIFTFSSCNHISESGDVGDKFYSYLQQENYDAIILLLDTVALKNYTKHEWKKLLSERNQYFGKLESYKPIGFHTETKKDYKIIKLKYEVSNYNGQVLEEIKLINRGKEIKILNYSFLSDIALANK
jgi:hypothetical protein